MRAALLHIAPLALSLAMTVTATAQTTKPEQQAKPDPSMTTIVGCLVQGNAVAMTSERRSDASMANANDFFLRTPTVAVPVGTTVAVGKPGTTSTATSAGSPAADSLYRITGMSKEQLSPHVGHRIELQGHLSANTKGDASVGATTAKTSVDAQGKATTTVETRPVLAGSLHAMTMKMVAPNCQ